MGTGVKCTVGAVAAAVLAVLALSCKLEIVPGGDSESFFLNILSMFGESFRPLGWADVIVFLAVFLSYRMPAFALPRAVEAVYQNCSETEKSAGDSSGKDCRERNAARTRISSWLPAVIFSVTYFTAVSFQKYSSLNLILASGYQIVLSLLCIAGFAVVLERLLSLTELLLEHLPEKRVTASQDTKAQSVITETPALRSRGFWITFAAIALLWLPWIVMNYPGSFCPDSQWQLQQFFGKTAWTAHHPPFSSWLMGACVAMGDLIADRNFGAFLYQLLQLLVGAAVFSYGLVLIRRFRIRRSFRVLAVLFYAVLPLWGMYLQWFEKDLLYAEVITWNLFLLVDTFRRMRACRQASGPQASDHLPLLLVTGVLASLLRNNGIYALAPTFFALGLYLLKKRDRRNAGRVLAVLMALVVIYGGVTGPLYNSLGIAKGSIAEAMSIPFQQTARVVQEYPDELKEEEKEIIDGVLDVGKMAEVYQPVTSDPVKALYHGDSESLSRYLSLWAKMLTRYPGVYVAAFLNMNYGYLAPVEAVMEPWIMTTDWYSGITELGIHHYSAEDANAPLIGRENSLGARIFGVFSSLSVNLPLLRILNMPGFYTWALFFMIWLFIRRRRPSGLIVTLPLFMNYLVCLASPLWNSTRYSLPLIAAMPVVIAFAAAEIADLS